LYVDRAAPREALGLALAQPLAGGATDRPGPSVPTSAGLPRPTARHRAGGFLIVFPTIKQLEPLAAYASADAAYDNASAPLECSPDDIGLAEFLGRLGGRALAQLRATEEQATQLESAAAGNRLLRRVAEVEERLRAAIIDGGGLPAIVVLVAEALKKPVAIYDADHRRLAAVTPEGASGLPVRLLERRDDHVLEALRAVRPGTATVIGAALEAGLRHRHLAAPIDLPDQRAGSLIIIEHPSRLAGLDRLVASRAAAHAALELATARRARSAAGDARSWLTRRSPAATTPPKTSSVPRTSSASRSTRRG